MDEIEDALKSAGGPDQVDAAVAALLDQLDPDSLEAVTIMVRAVSHELGHHPERRSGFEAATEGDGDREVALRALLAVRKVTSKGDSLGTKTQEFLQG